MGHDHNKFRTLPFTLQETLKKCLLTHSSRKANNYWWLPFQCIEFEFEASFLSKLMSNCGVLYECTRGFTYAGERWNLGTVCKYLRSSCITSAWIRLRSFGERTGKHLKFCSEVWSKACLSLYVTERESFPCAMKDHNSTVALHQDRFKMIIVCIHWRNKIHLHLRNSNLPEIFFYVLACKG